MRIEQARATLASNPPDESIFRLLRETKTIALVGASDKPHRDSHDVMQFLQGRGYRVIPVNPVLAGKVLLGETVRSALPEISEKIDIVDLFRRSEEVGPLVDQAVSIGAKAVWMQLGVVNEAAAERARAAGLEVVMDRCLKLECKRMDRLK
jgi:predicted CoA-binding protein